MPAILGQWQFDVFRGTPGKSRKYLSTFLLLEMPIALEKVFKIFYMRHCGKLLHVAVFVEEIILKSVVKNYNIRLYPLSYKTELLNRHVHLDI